MKTEKSKPSVSLGTGNTLVDSHPAVLNFQQTQKRSSQPSLDGSVKANNYDLHEVGFKKVEIGKRSPISSSAAGGRKTPLNKQPKYTPPSRSPNKKQDVII